MSEHLPQELERAEIDDAMRALSSISGELLTSYTRLAEKADRVENELQRRLGELEAILDSLPTGVLVRDADGRIVRANGAAVSIVGRPEDALRALDFDAFLAGLRREHDLVRVERPDGSRALVAFRSAPVHTPAGERTGTVEILDDRSEHVELTEHVHRMDKMAALGTMAAGIAHEIRNPINAIRGFAELLQREGGATLDASRVARFSGFIAAGASEVEEIIASMMTFADPRPLQPETIDVAELCADAVRSATEHVQEGRWEVSIVSASGSIGGDRVKLRQALRNLVANAMDAQTSGGAVQVLAQQEDDEFVFAVHDGGPGVPEELRSRLIDPFFTTRAEGTGLGLTLVHTIAQLHGGRLAVSERPSRLGGAVFELRLPHRPTSTQGC